MGVLERIRALIGQGGIAIPTLEDAAVGTPRGERTRSPFFCGDPLHHLDLEIALGDEPLQTAVLLLQRTQPPGFVDVIVPKRLRQT